MAVTLQLIEIKDGYSYYENPDPEIKQAILDLEPPTELTEYWEPDFREDKWFFKEHRPNGSVLIESNNGNLTTMTLEDYKHEVRDAALQHINRTFSVGDLMNQHCMPMYIGKSIYHKMFSQPLKMGFRQETFYDGVNSVFMVEEYSCYDGHHKTEFESSFGNGNGHIFFNLDGNIVNRDYNQDLNDTTPFVTKQQVIQEFLDIIKRRIGDSVLETAPTKDQLVFYIEGWALKLWDQDSTELTIEWFPHTTKNNYFAPGDSYRKITKPKKVEVIPVSEFLDFLEKKCNGLKQNKFWEWASEKD